MTAYRNDIDALAARDEVLARELADKQRERADVQRMLEEARLVEAAEAHERDVMVGRRRLRRVGAVASLLVATGVAIGVGLVVARGPSQPAPRVAMQDAPRDEVRFGLLLAGKGMTLVELEPRFVAGDGFASADDLHAALGGPIAAWEQFTFTRDAHARQAIASPLFGVGEPAPDPEFASDGYGGVWRVISDRREQVPSPTWSGRVTRKVWLLPYGSVFRGDVDVR